MRRYTLAAGLSLSLLALLTAPATAPAQQARSDRGSAGSGAAMDLSAAKPGRDPKQPIDEAYTKKIREYTTEPFFLSPLVDYLPASKTVPTPEAVLGDIAGSPTKLPYSTEVYAYMRMLAKATPRVRVYSIGRTEEGREMIAVAIASDSLMASLDRNKANLAQLADPRTIDMDDARAERIIGNTTPVYYITGTIHSTESGAPTALMELAYRLAVDDSPYIRNIRDHLITLITPIVEVDGRDREVDLVKWHFAHPGETYSNLIYWGHYVAHDNNRDAMGLTLKLSQNVLNTYLGWDAQVLHDLHESVPFLYDNTIGDGPYNAWIDPLLANEWRMIGWNNVQEMTRLGMPGVFAHGDFDTWSPGYLMFMAAMHNGISRLYETFGNGGTPETMERTLSADETSRTWYRQDPPLPRVKWSMRNNNNYEETGLLVSLNYFATNRRQFLENFYEKSKRSILKARTEGPAAYVFSADDPRLGPQAELLRVLQKQHVEISRATKGFTVQVPAAKMHAARGANAASAASEANAAPDSAKTVSRTFPTGSYIVRMDQPYSRIADALLDYQYWSPDDPQKQPYDDTGWTFPELFAVQSVRVTDQKVLDVPMTRMTDSVRASGGVSGQGSVFAIDQNGDNSLATLRYQLASADMQVAEEPFQAAGHSFARGSFVIRGVSASALDAAAKTLGLQAYALSSAPSVALHPARAARVAILHTWTGTQTEGWWRLAFDVMHIPYTYISVQDIAKTADLNAVYDVILFPPAGGSTKSIVDGLPMWRNPMPWKHTPETPNIGTWAQTDDIRPGMGFEGLANLHRFVARGGVLVGVTNTATFATTYGFTNGVTMTAAPRGHVVGSILRTRVVDGASPIMYGVEDGLAVYSENGESFTVSNGGFGRRGGGGGDEGRPTGRGTATDPDVVQGRAALAPENEAPKQPDVKPWEAAPVTDEQLRNPVNIIPPDQRPRVVLRFSGQNDLLVSGLLDGGKGIAEHAVVVDVPMEKGHVVLFGNNPVYRGETIGSYALVLNTVLNFDHLDAGRTLAVK
ncbi:MAG TPA: M14 family zinc carboxypeptidase [Gemmatimonadaceae bacterium]|nr:M14 family zinc carboxypeptidase [Gemmatimonadaceae bacterium]